MEYPDEIVLERGSSEFNNLTKHSRILKDLSENEDGDITLSADLLFSGDDKKWEIFVDVFFPELAVKRFFVFHKNGQISVDPKRGTKQDLIDLLDYMDVAEPSTMMNFAKQQARKSLNASAAEIIPRGIGIRRPGKAAQAFAAQQAIMRANRNNYNNFGYGNYRTFEEEENNNGANVFPNRNENNGNNNNNNNNNNQNNVNLAKPPARTLGNFLGKVTRRNRKNRKATRRQVSRKGRKASRKSTRRN